MFLEQIRPVVFCLRRLGVAKKTLLCLHIALKVFSKKIVLRNCLFTQLFFNTKLKNVASANTPWRLLPLKTWRRANKHFNVFVFHRKFLSLPVSLGDGGCGRISTWTRSEGVLRAPSSERRLPLLGSGTSLSPSSRR